MSQDLDSIIKKMDNKFTSTNSHPVERTTLTREDWKEIKSYIEDKVVKAMWGCENA